MYGIPQRLTSYTMVMEGPEKSAELNFQIQAGTFFFTIYVLLQTITSIKICQQESLSQPLEIVTVKQKKPL